MVDDNMDENVETIKNENNKGKAFTTSETVILVIVSLIVGVLIGFLYSNGKSTETRIIKEDKYVSEFLKNYNFIINNYYESVDKEDLINSAIAGMMESLNDPYSVYINEEETNNFKITLDGSYEGIGVQIIKDSKTGYMLITAVFKDSPAADAGIIPGDMIISIDDKNSSDLTSSEFASIIKTSTSKTHKFLVLRDGEEFSISVARNLVTLKSVMSEIYEEGNKKIGYIYIGIFANNTYAQFKEELEKLEDNNIDALIIDVRGNTGGHLTTVDGILDLFLNKNQIMYQFEKDNKVTSTYGTGNENKDYEIVLIGDEVSASASEVLIAGLKENLNSTFIGKKTYGKGTVQELVTLTDGTQYKITVKKWLTPKGNWIDETKGISPDIEVELNDKYFETYEKVDDSQLMAAIEYIKNK